MQEIRTERTNLFEPNDYITFYTELSGNVKAEDLAAAVKEAYKANESTISKVVLKPDGAACYEKLPESGCKVEIEDCGQDWREIVRRMRDFRLCFHRVS